MPNKESDQQSSKEVLDFVSGLTDSALLRIEESLPHGFVRLKLAEAERRQARHDIRSVEDIVTELVRNSRDAGAKRILVALQKEKGRYRRITVIDDGCGIPADMHQLVFEPRVTSKSQGFEEDRYGVHGRGMALFSIRSRVSNARISSSIPGAGTAVALMVDTREIGERSDQATMPVLEKSGDSLEVGAGPHNIGRVLLEVSVDFPGVDIYCGSVAEVLATVVRFEEQKGERPLWSGLSETDDARVLSSSAAEIGLPVSERNAYRVLNQEIEPLTPVIEKAPRVLKRTEEGLISEKPKVTAGRRHRRDRNPVRRVSRQDLERISDEAQGVAEKVLRRYFLRIAGRPQVRRGRGKITISFHVTDEGDEG